MKKLLLSFALMLALLNPAFASVTFDGTDDFVSFGSSSTVDDQHPFSVYMVVEIVNHGADDILATKATAGSSTGSWDFKMSTTSTIRFEKEWDGTNLNVVASDSTVTTGVKYAFVVTYDGTATASTGVHIYKDGAEVGYKTQTNGTGSIRSDASYNLCVGAFGDASNAANIIVYDFGFIDRVLTAAEALALSTGRIKFSALQYGDDNTMVYSTMNECGDAATCSGTSQFWDYSGNGNHGTASNSPVGTSERHMSYP